MSRAAQNISFRTHDPEEGHAFLVQAYADNTMRVRGPREEFELRYDASARGPLYRAQLSYGLAIEHDVEPLGQLLLGRVLRGRLERTTSGRTVRFGPGEVFLVAAPDAPYQISWTDMDLELVAVDLPSVRDLAPSTGAAIPRFEAFEPVSAAWGTQCGAAMDLARHALMAPATGAALYHDNVARTVAAAVLAAFPHRRLEQGRRDLTQRAETVRLALEFMEANAEQPLTLQAVAFAAHVAPRTLQLAFRSELETTPMEQLRRIRLARAHRDLVRADPASGATVTDIALRWGFTHPSRFAAAYRRRYGRSPRDSLQA